MRRVLIYIWIFIKIFFTFTLSTTFIYSHLPVYLTPIMLIRTLENIVSGEPKAWSKSWVSYEEISPNVFKAFIAAEDTRFFIHEGIDWEAVEKAKKYNERYKGRKKRGASTITMQTAKNTFLFHNRNYFRKAMEVYFTFLIEPIWGKQRILEVYANIIEFGDNIYGIEAASNKFFKKPAKKLTKRECSIFAAILPNPHIWKANRPTNYILRRASTIRARMSAIKIPKNVNK